MFTLTPSVLALLLAGVVFQAGAEPLPQSASLAKQLAQTLTERKLEAIAAHDPDEPDRFVAALLFGKSQLLVVSARHEAPASLQARLAHKQYREAYLDLQSSPIRDGSLFFQDMNADGLCFRRGQLADVLYEGSAPPRIFDGERNKDRTSADAYERDFLEADRRYSHVLTLLLAQTQVAS
jgi:hypothetical protein